MTSSAGEEDDGVVEDLLISSEELLEAGFLRKEGEGEEGPEALELITILLTDIEGFPPTCSSF